LAEGKTDYLHLESSIRRLQAQGEFMDIELRFQPDPQDRGGHDELLKHCEGLSRLKQQPPVVCIFDRDNPRTVARVMAPEKPFKDWGNGVFSVALPYPPHRDPHEPLCIELLYDDDLLRKPDSQGRRLYFKNEFDQESGHHLTERVNCANPKKDSLIRDDDVFSMDNGGKVSLSKRAFAEAIKAARDPYATAAVDGFRPLFEVLSQIARHLRAAL
jgi:RNA-directed DNA polymerase